MLLQVNSGNQMSNKYKNMICCLFRWDQAGRRQQQQPSGPLSLWSVFLCQYLCSFLSVFLWVFLVSISFCQYLLSVFLSAICIYFNQFFGTACFLDSIFLGQHLLGCIFFGTAWFLGSVYCQCSFCKLEKYAFPSIEKRISF